MLRDETSVEEQNSGNGEAFKTNNCTYVLLVDTHNIFDNDYFSYKCIKNNEYSHPNLTFNNYKMS